MDFFLLRELRRSPPVSAPIFCRQFCFVGFLFTIFIYFVYCGMAWLCNSVAS